MQKKVVDLFSNLRAAARFNSNPNAASETVDGQKQSNLTFFNAISIGSLEMVKEMIDTQKIKLPELILDDESQQQALHYALEEKQEEIAKYFIDIWDSHLLCKNYNVNVKKISGKKNALHRITEEGYVELAKVFLSRLDEENRKKTILQEIPMDILGQRPRTLSCLHLAAYIGSIELIELYLNQGVEVNSQNSKGDTALLWAARWNNTGVMETLLKAGANPNIGNDKGSTALHWAVRYQHVDAVRILTANPSIEINTQRKLGLISPIILSSALGSVEIVTLLIYAGADVNQKIRGEERPIHHAAKEGHEEVLELLIRRGADINADDALGNTALFLAIKNDHPLSVHVLVKAGSDLCHKNRDGMDVWSYALFNESNKCLETLVYCIKKLINEKKSNPIEDIKVLLTKQSPIFQAAAVNATEKLTALASMDIDLETRDHNENTLQHYAALQGRYEVIRQFADAVDVNSKNRYGETPLHFACSIGCFETVKALLDCKAKANLKNKLGETALHTAANSQKMDSKTMKLLMEYMIKTHSWDSLNEKDKNLRTAIHVAALKAKPEVIWECRFISCKDVDVDGNTPFHLAVRQSQPEIFRMMLSIYEFTNRDADVDQENCKCETPLHLVALEGFKKNTEKLIYYGVDLRKRDCNGNSILHKLVEASVEDATNMEKHLEMMDLILDKAITSYCIREEIDYPSNDLNKMAQYRFTALMELLFDNKNNENLSVFDFACKMAAKEALEKLLMLQGVTRFSISNQEYFDITHMTPRTNDSLESFCSRRKVKPRISCIEWLLSVEDTERASMLLDIPPLNVVEEMYGRTCSWVYFILMTLHIIYMGLISFNADRLEKKAQIANVSDVIIMDDMEHIIFHGVTPIEPIIILLCSFLAMIRSNSIWHVSQKGFFREICSLRMVCYIYNNYTPLVIMLLFSAMIITWMILYLYRFNVQRILLSISLCIGWMICIIFTRGFKGVHHFWRMLRIMIFRDGLRFLFLYAFVLLSFSFSMHVLLNLTKGDTAFGTIFSIFNLMLGITDTFSDELTASLRNSLLVDLIYSAYIVLGSIILLNLLIAMMNDSYQAIQIHESLSWRLDSMRLGLNVEKFIPYFTKLSSRGKIIKRSCMVQGDIIRWYVILPARNIKKYQRRRDWIREERSQITRYKSK